MNKNLLYSLLAFCTILTGCNSDGTSDVSSSASESSVSEVLSSEDSLSNTVESTVTESSSEEQVEAEYVTIDDVNTLFTTYEDETTLEDFDFSAKEGKSFMIDITLAVGKLNTCMMAII